MRKYELKSERLFAEVMEKIKTTEYRPKLRAFVALIKDPFSSQIIVCSKIIQRNSIDIRMRTIKIEVLLT